MVRQHSPFQLLPVKSASEGLRTVWSEGTRMKEQPLCSPPTDPVVPITSAPALSDLPPGSEPEPRACGFIPQTLMARKAGIESNDLKSWGSSCKGRAPGGGFLSKTIVSSPGSKLWHLLAWLRGTLARLHYSQMVSGLLKMLSPATGLAL